MPLTGYTFPRKRCSKCWQLISIAQFKKHKGSAACAEVARLNAKALQLIKK